MNLNLENATVKDGIYSWNVTLSNYKIQTITVVSSTKTFNARYNDVTQYLESGRPDDTCPAIFSGNFSVFFYTYMPSFIITDIQDIQITLS